MTARDGTFYSFAVSRDGKTFTPVGAEQKRRLLPPLGQRRARGDDPLEARKRRARVSVFCDRADKVNFISSKHFWSDKKL
jgi:hypothetical protein